MSAPARILIVEDDRAALDYLEGILVGGGYEVLRAPDGIRGLSIAFAGDVDLVCLDLRMPDLDGEDVCMALRSNADTKPIPILVVTQIEPEKAKGLVLAIGANDYIQKDRVADELLDRVGSLLR